MHPQDDRIQQYFRDSEIILGYSDGLRLCESFCYDDDLRHQFSQQIGEPIRHRNYACGTKAVFGTRRNTSDLMDRIESYFGYCKIEPSFDISKLDGQITFKEGLLVERTRWGWTRYPYGD